jgi:VCBS repeat-containing protein
MAATLFAGALTMAADGSWTGWISDSQCGVKGVNDADKKVYVVDAQDKVAAHAGHHVTVKGTVDGENLKLTSIDMAAAAK